jgi:hypothetical protein
MLVAVLIHCPAAAVEYARNNPWGVTASVCVVVVSWLALVMPPAGPLTAAASTSSRQQAPERNVDQHFDAEKHHAGFVSDLRQASAGLALMAATFWMTKDYSEFAVCVGLCIAALVTSIVYA